jgi:hypothetical protein
MKYIEKKDFEDEFDNFDILIIVFTQKPIEMILIFELIWIFIIFNI